ncbi:4-hydroxy-2-oxoheptanedioate aldolase [Aquabacter sp. P-9]|uniref:4-hydroxy-2-oxoheptanedioate aldolase n=1 Tax=Aquabacter sediminis TaxID=3029197 RepID=UPI00237D830D|nr:4-hydroxy-2-oxoheptanedioate aldolase [Aquabacter sp. P-9]MDE1569013.1 4-hydroxy-2-oxoheptanedioate aldolase [Aquabacter sp. P-9]
MPAPTNRFKAALAEGRTLTGLWLALANAYTAEICAGAGYDWLLVDGEHAPNHIQSLVAQLQVLEGGPSAAIVRPPVGETWMIKQLLDIGAQTLLIPMVESGAQAQTLVKAVRYPPHGVRGIGAALARASDFNRVTDYLVTADAEICLLLQVESRAGVAAIDDICAVDGVDGVFVGPADLAADLGFLGRPGAPEVVAAVEGAIARIRANGKPAGVLTSDPALAQRYHAAGATFIAIGTDVGLLAGAAARQLKDFPFAGA